MAELFNAGDHVPVMPLVEVVGKADKEPPEQMAATWLKVGIVGELITTVVVAISEHPFARVDVMV